jgi:dipeptidyl aminopeptidase/acylaminoacyl peptidase
MSGPSVDQVAQAALKFDELRATPRGLAWLERRPQLAGRAVVVEWNSATGVATELTSPDLDAGSWAHAYGGGAHVEGPAVTYAVRGADSQIVRVDADGEHAITSSAGDGTAYGDLNLCADGTLLAVRESLGTKEGDALVAITNAMETVLVRGDFLAAPALGPDRRLAWLRWSVDEMPWDATELVVGHLSPSGVASPLVVAGGPDESVVEPTWGPDGALYFVSDRSGWWNLYRWDGQAVAPVAPMEAECAAAPWELGYRSYVHLSDRRIALLRQTGALVDLVVIATDGAVTVLPLPYTSYKPCLAVCSGKIAAIAASVSEAPHVVLIDPDLPHHVQVLARGPALPGIALSMPERLHLNVDGGGRLDALFYPAQAHGEAGGEPLIVRPHPGPTDNMRERLSWWTQYFTGQGFGVVELDYRGSTGYGRPFRQSLYGHWGSFDVEDAVVVAQHLISTGRADPERVFISGESAGGYTALRATSHPDAPFAGAVASMAIVDPERWRHTVPRFQRAHAARLARGTSPAQASTIARPVLLLHGSHDSVVPIADTAALADQLSALGKPSQLIVLDGEGHGYSAPTMAAAALEAEEHFYRQLLARASGVSEAVRYPA